MNQKILCTTAALLTAAFGIPLASYAESNREVNPSRVNGQVISSQTLLTAQVVKVGEYQSQPGKKADNTVIARIETHEQAGRSAATLYVRNIPVLTFLSPSSAATSSTKVGTAKVATVGKLPNLRATDDDVQVTNSPVWQASAVAAKLNELNLEGVDASKITVNWKAGSKSGGQKLPDSYLIKVNNQQLVELNGTTRLAQPTKDLAQDALQATNRLRRLVGNAPPLKEIAGRPQPSKLAQAFSLPSVRRTLSGMASWYGPGFHGRRSANGEVFNQNALTAAHKSLPFGTKVRVTNTRNGRSVVVRINDRGPYAHGRVIDLSAAAARLLGVMQSGTAPVRLDVLGR